ncbi:MAG TPA: hypothetical protein VEH27_02610, partial [Methylomirabilota bacterium]|nr:hypothetical protein [Methylomirabilota bacterium]
MQAEFTHSNPRKLFNRLLAVSLGAVGLLASSHAVIVTDPQDMGDANGDIRQISATVQGDSMIFTMTVHGLGGPSIAQTAEGMVNRHYYHWLLDTDNNPATGRSNAEYEGNSTGLTKPIGIERVIMVGWRNGKREGIEVYNPLDDDVTLASGFPVIASGNTLTAIVPLSALGVAAGQTVAVSAFQEGASEGWKVDWVESATMTVQGPPTPVANIADPADMGDSSGDIRSVRAVAIGDHLALSMTVNGVAAPAVEETIEGMVNRYYYHWLLDTDNNPATGRSNAEYEGNSTGLTKPIGSERVIMIGWRDGKPNGLEIYDPLDDDTTLLSGFPFHARGNTLTAFIPFSALGVARGQTIAVSAFQEGASEGWKVDWVESATLTLDGPNPPIATVLDPADLPDTSGDIRRVTAHVEGDDLHLNMTVHGVVAPTIEGTPEGKVNRYYYHWLLDTDNNPATGRSNAEYEGNSTGLTKPLGAERVIMIGWRDGKPNGVEVYNPLDEDTAIASNIPFQASGNRLTAVIPLSTLGLVPGQTIAVSAFQEGASDGWQVDWVEAATLVLNAGVNTTGQPTLAVEANFTGNAHGFELQLIDATTNVVDASSVQVTLDGAPATASATKANGVTRIIGQHTALLQPDSVHEIGLSVKVNGAVQTRTFVFRVPNFTVLPLASRMASPAANSSGFTVHMTAITSAQLLEGGSSAHSNLATRAEMQLAGELKPEGSDTAYLNELDFTGGGAWKGAPIIEPGVINWFELAPDSSTPINFPADKPFPGLDPSINQGLVAEITTYLDLTAGNHTLGLYSEGGHKVTAGFAPNSPVIALFDNSGNVQRIPTYFARSQFFDVVAPVAGLYPIRILWFQNRRSQEPGVLLEFFSVKDRALHLVNDSSDPLSIKAYRSALP